MVKIAYQGNSWVFANSLKIVCDDSNFEFKDLKFTRANYTTVIEACFLDYNSEVRDMVECIINSKETIIRFYGEKGYFDYTVTDRIKTDLKAFSNTIKAIENN
jgi:hypothetical protein